MERSEYYQVEIRGKDPDSLWPIVEESRFDPKIFRLGVLKLESSEREELLAKLGESFRKINPWVGFLPCSGNNSWLHFLASQIELDRESVLDYFGIDCTGGEMTELRYVVPDGNDVKKVQLRAMGIVKSENYAALRIAPLDYDTLRKGKVLVISPTLSETNPGGADGREFVYTLVQPLDGERVRVSKINHSQALAIISSEPTIKCFVFDFC